MQLKNRVNFPTNFIQLQSDKDFDHFRYVGKVVAEALSNLEQLVSDKTIKTLKELDKITEEYFVQMKCQPVFKGYKGFPATLCASVNYQLVHGIPTDYALQEGDLISFDTGCSYQGAIADSALTCIYGKPKEEWHKKLIEATQQALYAAIKEVKVGERLGNLGNAIFHSARKDGFKVIENFGGHGIAKNKVHGEPFICNKDEKNQGIRMQVGNVFAIEPLLVPKSCSTKTKIADDGWTILTEEMSAHHEHSMLLTDRGVEVLTKRTNETNFLG
jgi:methionyl aminopeptidase